ncbi:MAG TPA: phosphate ABC transporter permease PstA [Candidatus Ruania gallistercoris]|uniref:Phosphate transport system permease protein PstA n=1 Tax=Candidatus Ruania gallistercoris TaxID=2838746 RepID=A0A9D2ED20_9MICO|nr:phosphate ABC transporter permease PstA [Candidatus Ruania gallistercoris]
MAVAAPPLPVRRHRRLPRWAPYATLLASLALAAGILALFAEVTLGGLFALAAVCYAVAITVLSRVVEGPRWAKDRLATALVTVAFLLAVIPLFTLLGIVVGDGMQQFSWEFLTTDMVGVFGAMTSGGAFHAMIGTLYVTGIAAVIAVPLGIFTAIYLVEYGQGAIKRGITLLVDVMTGIPSIVAGLFAYTMFLVLVGPQYKSALIGGVALTVLMTPLVVRNVEEMLRLVPNELREASYALGVPKWLTIVKVVLRTSIGGITMSVIIALARIIGETAPLLITVGTLDAVNWDMFDGRIETLPVYVYRQYAQGGASTDRAWAGALTLIIIVMLLNLIARLVSRYFTPKVSR